MATYGAMGRLASSVLIPIDSPLVSFAVNTAPVAAAEVKPYRYATQVGVSAWMSDATILSGVVTQVETTPASRIIPTWALDYRGYFQSTAGYTASTAYNTGFPILNNNHAGYFSTGTYVQQPAIGIPITGVLAGVTQEDGVNVGGRTVALLYRPTNQIIQSILSDVEGNWIFKGLEPGVSDYYVIGLNLRPLQYDAVIHDTVTPAFVSDVPAGVPVYDAQAVQPGFMLSTYSNTQTLNVDLGDPTYGAYKFTYAFYRNGTTLLRWGTTTSRYVAYVSSKLDADSTVSCQFTAYNGAGPSSLTYVEGVYVS